MGVSGNVWLTLPKVAVTVKVEVPGGVGIEGGPPVPPPPPPQAVIKETTVSRHRVSRNFARRYLPGRIQGIPAIATTGHSHIVLRRSSDAVAAVVFTETTTVSGLLSGRGSEVLSRLHFAPAGAPVQLTEMVPPANPNPGKLATITL